MFTDHKKFNYE
jgi:hypothetical protein